MPQHTATGQFLRRRFAAHPAQTTRRQLHAILLAPRAEGVGRGPDRSADARGVLGMYAGENRLGIEQ
ncbi:hypothetical protein D3C81_1116500 [compost metagenome]